MIMLCDFDLTDFLFAGGEIVHTNLFSEMTTCHLGPFQAPKSLEITIEVIKKKMTYLLCLGPKVHLLVIALTIMA